MLFWSAPGWNEKVPRKRSQGMPQLGVCVYVCARACACVCACVLRSQGLSQLGTWSLLENTQECWVTPVRTSSDGVVTESIG